MWVKKGANQNQNSKKLIIQKILKMIWTLFLILKNVYFINELKKLSALTKPAKVFNMSNKVLLCYFYSLNLNLTHFYPRVSLKNFNSDV